jgi:hypothetical protein
LPSNYLEFTLSAKLMMRAGKPSIMCVDASMAFSCKAWVDLP